jgi:opacity protein-like surface antigen
MKLKHFYAPLALASLVVGAAPAVAGARVEARVGVLSEGGNTVTIGGIAAGYDFDLPGPVFLGGEVSIDNNFTSSSGGVADVLVGLTARAGIKVGVGGRAYVTGGATLRSLDNSPYHAGAGYQQAIGPKLYLKAEYRHFFATGINDDGDAAMAGVGFKF